jgi:hypothetical protein
LEEHYASCDNVKGSKQDVSNKIPQQTNHYQNILGNVVQDSEEKDREETHRESMQKYEIRPKVTLEDRRIPRNNGPALIQERANNKFVTERDSGKDKYETHQKDVIVDSGWFATEERSLVVPMTPGQPQNGTTLPTVAQLDSLPHKILNDLWSPDPNPVRPMLSKDRPEDDTEFAFQTKDEHTMGKDKGKWIDKEMASTFPVNEPLTQHLGTHTMYSQTSIVELFTGRPDTENCQSGVGIKAQRWHEPGKTEQHIGNTAALHAICVEQTQVPAVISVSEKAGSTEGRKDGRAGRTERPEVIPHSGSGTPTKLAQRRRGQKSDHGAMRRQSTLIFN